MSAASVRVPFMDLETRVAALETDFAALHTSNNSQHHDMRVEYRGWAEHAVHAHEKLNTAKEMMHLILADVREIKETHGRKLDDLTITVAGHTQKLDDLTTTVNGHTQVLGEHTQKLDEHGTLLREILAKVS
jgi:hypothetical protein